MTALKRQRFTQALLGCIAVCFAAASAISSCGKTGAGSASSMNIQYQVINVAPGLGPVSLYIDYRSYNNLSFHYGSPSGYFNLSSIDTPFQIRRTQNPLSTVIVSTANIFSLDYLLKPNSTYTLFIGGMAADSSLTYRFLTDYTDTSRTPPTGQGRIRFVNFSPQSGAFDVTANGTRAFAAQQFGVVSRYIYVPAGNYTFNVLAAGTASVIGGDANVTIQDGRSYTLYSYGIAGHTDTLSFGMHVITNR